MAAVSHLVQFEAHPHGGSHHLLQEVHVSEHPLVLGGDAEVSFEERVEAVQEGLKAGGRVTEQGTRVRAVWSTSSNILIMHHRFFREF